MIKEYNEGGKLKKSVLGDGVAILVTLKSFLLCSTFLDGLHLMHLLYQVLQGS